MDAVRQQNDERVARRVYPEGRAGEAGVAERAEREQLAARSGKGRVNVPAETAQCGTPRRRLRSAELRHGSGRENVPALGSGSSGEQHPAEDGEVVHVGKK